MSQRRIRRGHWSIVGLYVRAIYAWRALKQIDKPHLGGIVTYRGEKCRLYQGVYSPKWHLSSAATGEIFKFVPVPEFELDRSLRGRWAAFKSSYDFWMAYWFTIDVRRVRGGMRI